MSKRKQEHEKEPNHERWLVSYADFITLLFAVFVTLYAMSYVDKQKVDQVIASTNAAFGLTKSNSTPAFNVIQSSDIMPVPGVVAEKKKKMSKPETGELGKQEKERKKAEEEQKLHDQKEKLKTGAVDDIPPPDPNLSKGKETETKKRAGEQEFKEIKEKISSFLSAKGAQEKVKLTLDSRGLVISLKDTEFFDSGSASVRQWSLPLLNDIANSISNYSNAIRIEGHTDNVPINTPSFPSNWELSTARATNIVQYLISRHGFSPEKLSAIGYGEYRPIADNSTEEGKQKNRRVDVVILSNTGEQGEPTAGPRKEE
jgi:chemotaxis protein MotB